MVNMEKFMTWLNDEIMNLERTPEINLYKSGEEAGLLRVRQKLCDMDAEIGEVDLDDIAGQICDKYCMFPQAYYTGHDDDNERMVTEKCNHCPLNKLVR